MKRKSSAAKKAGQKSSRPHGNPHRPPKSKSDFRKKFVARNSEKRLQKRKRIAKSKRPSRGLSQLYTDDGLILICDIVDFSRLPHERQAEVVKCLWAYLQQGKVRHLLRDPKRYLINGTGDGLMLAYHSYSEKARHREFIEVAAGFVRHVRKSCEGIHLRVGVHQGPFSFVKVAGKKRSNRQAVGTGINQCARIVSLGDKDTVTVGENFVSKWGGRTGDSIYEHFKPGRGHQPYEVVIKRGEVFSVRFYAPENTPLLHASRKIEAFKVVRELITRELEAMEHGLIQLLHEAQPELKTRAPLDIRFSVLTERISPHGGERTLCTTDYRYHRNGNAVKAGSTVYPLTGKGTSPAAWAFMNNASCVVHGLPEWHSTDEDSKKRYYAAFTENRPYDPLPRESVDGFGRHARAFLTFPFALMKVGEETQPHPDGVICIDILQALDGFLDKHLVNFADLLGEKFSQRLSTLWRLRGAL